jgi:hypothetical protein
LFLLFVFAPHVALHRVCIRTLMSHWQCRLGAGWGSRGESMLPFLGRPWKAKTRTQSSEHGVVATGRHGHLLSGCLVEGHIGFLGSPKSMEQDGQLTGYRNDGLAPGLLTASGSQMQTPLSKR